MDVWKAIRTIGRRWYVSIIVCALCIAATSSLVSSAKSVYTSEATLILLPPSVKLADIETDEVRTNPFLETGVPYTATALTSAASSDRVADLLKDAGLGDVTFLVSNGDQSPIIVVSTESGSAEMTTEAINVVVDAVIALTAELQTEAQAPDNQFLTAQVLAPPPGAPVESVAAKTKIAMGMAVASFLIVLCSALLFDNVANRFSRRRALLAEDQLELDLAAEDVERGYPAPDVHSAPTVRAPQTSARERRAARRLREAEGNGRGNPRPSSVLAGDRSGGEGQEGRPAQNAGAFKSAP